MENSASCGFEAKELNQAVTNLYRSVVGGRLPRRRASA